MKNEENPNLPKLAYSLDEAARMLSVSKGHLRNENIRGKLHFLRSGRRTLVTEREIQRYMSEIAELNIPAA